MLRSAGAPWRLPIALAFLLGSVAATAAAPSAATRPTAAAATAATQVAAPSATPDTARCVDASSLVLRRILAPPPRTGSARVRAELDELLRIQAHRTSSEAALARRDAVRSIYRFADALAGAPGLETARLPRTLALLRHIGIDETAVLTPAKRDFARPRPFALEPRLAPIVTRPRSGSYPSGHALWAYTTALVLADMVPERRGQLLARANQYARNRTVAGVHYPSDVEAGKLAGTALAAMLFDCPAFEREEAGARQELRGALRLP